MKTSGRIVKTKRLKPRMTEEELKVWYAKRKKTCYHKSKKSYDRNDKGYKKEFEETLRKTY
jgi:hypothetical protein